MELPQALLLSLLLAVCRSAFAKTICKGDLVMAYKCSDSREKTCQHPGGHIVDNDDCKRERRCVCPNSNLLRYNERCYTTVECPKVSLDAKSDSRIGHNFIVPGKVNGLNEVYGTHISALKLPPHWYHAIALFKIVDATCARKVKTRHANASDSHLTINYRVPIKLVNMLQEGNVFFVTIGTGIGLSFKPLAQCDVRVEKVLDLRRYKFDQPFPVKQKYFLFGDSSKAYITHIPTACKDFQQVALLKRIPRGVSIYQLRSGVVLQLPELKGSPALDDSQQIIDPLVKAKYNARYNCRQAMDDLENDDNNDACDSGADSCRTTQISIKKKYQMDARIINIACA